jgi:hypothetical protein
MCGPDAFRGLFLVSVRRVAPSHAFRYAEVWAEPMTRVAARYDVSANYLARVCFHLNVPVPHRGYWAKVQHGKTRSGHRCSASLAYSVTAPSACPGEEIAGAAAGDCGSSPGL